MTFDMKKSILIAAAVLMFSACTKDNGGNDNGNGNGNGNGENEKVTYDITYSAGKEGFDNFLFYDMKIYYKNAEGKTVEEDITEYPMVREVKGAETPFTAEFTPVYTMKNLEDIKSDKETFKICGLAVSAIYKSSDGNIEDFTISSSSMTLPLEKAYEYVQRQVERYSGKTISKELND